MNSKKNEIKPHKIKEFQKTIINTPEIYENMQKELLKTKDFAKRLEIVVDTIENLFRLQNNQALLTYSEFKKLRKAKKRKKKSLKNKKNYKKWK